MAPRPTTRWGVTALALAGWVLLAAGLRTVVLLPERCPPAHPERVRRAAGAAVGWLATNQAADGRWLYRYRAVDDVDLGGYNVVRHAGVLLSLYQAAAAGLGAAEATAERGLAWALGNLSDGPGWRALGAPGLPLDTGATALLVAALVERRQRSGDPGHDPTLAALGRFLLGQLEASGAVAQRWDPGRGPSFGSYSRFFTGETFWALARLHAVLPDGGWREPALRVGRYLAEHRDRAEGHFPAVADHWAAYGLAEVGRWPDGAVALAGLDPAGRYAERLGGLVGVQIRYESQRTDELPSRLTRGRRTLGAGLGTLGEAEANLWALAARPVPALAARDGADAGARAGAGAGADGEATARRRRAVLAQRVACVAGMLVERQLEPAEAAHLPRPARAAGAWYQFGVTQMDDQQHALSALLLAGPVVGGAPGSGR